MKRLRTHATNVEIAWNLRGVCGEHNPFLFEHERMGYKLMQISCPCYFSSPEGDIRKVSKILTSRNWFELVLILYQPVGQFSGNHRNL